jgi:hypothetical protein
MVHGWTLQGHEDSASAPLAICYGSRSLSEPLTRADGVVGSCHSSRLPTSSGDVDNALL